MQLLCTQDAVANRLCKPEAVSVRFVATMSQKCQTCLKLDASLKGFSENVQRYSDLKYQPCAGNIAMCVR